MATCPPEPCKVVSDSTGTTPDAACPPISFDAGNYRIAYSGRCLTKQKRPDAVPDGWYSRVRIVDGVIVEAREESGQQVVIENPCSNAGGTNDGLIGVSLDSCNLASITSDGLLNTRLFYSYDRFMTVGGCGSASSPLTFFIDVEGLRASILAGGANFTGCGISIENGVVTSFVQPITNIVSNNPALQIIRDGCTVTLNVTASATSIAYSRPWCRVGANGVRVMRGVGVVMRGGGNTANVVIYSASEGDTPPTPPSSFQNVQEAINWVDANMTC